MNHTYPVFKQLDSMDCGATCLKMVAQYHGRSFPIEYLRQLTHLSKDGVGMTDISEAAEKIGLRTLAVKVTYDVLLQHSPFPCIAHWNRNHFVVVYGITKGKVLVADPAIGLQKIQKEAFIHSWAQEISPGQKEGIVLLFEPTPHFFENQDDIVTSKSSVSHFWHYLKPHRGLFVQIFIGLIVTSILQLFLPMLTQAIVDVGIVQRDIRFIYILMAASVMIFLGRLLTEYIRAWIVLHITSRINIQLISDFLYHLMGLPVRFFEQRRSADLLQRISDNERIQQFLTSSSLVTLFSVLNILIFGLVLFFYSGLIFTIFIVFILLEFLWVFLFLKKRKRLDYAKFEVLANSQSSLMEIIFGIKDIKLHRAEKLKRWKWESNQVKLFKVNEKSMALDQYQRTGASFLNEMKDILIVFLSAKLVIEGKMTLGSMLAMQYIIGQLHGPFDTLVSFVTQLQDARISFSRLKEIQEQPLESEGSKLTFIPESADIQFKNVSFRYGGETSPMVLKNISFKITHGKTTAIVGSSGSGKTTIIKLLMKDYQPIQGDILMGDVNLEQLDTAKWKEQCGSVSNEAYIFSDSIGNNIALGDMVADWKKLHHAVKIANFQSYIESLPLGYETKVGEEGIGLSQGQRQRLIIARAVYKNPPYLYFDEATSALDAFNELIIMENLSQFNKNKTVVIVAHRLSTVVNADNIIVLESGEIIEEGTHQQLVQLRGAYYNLIKNQLELGN